MRQLGGSIKETLDINFGSTGDDKFEPRSICSCVGHRFQEDSTTLIVATFVKCVNDKHERLFRVARKVAKEIKEERILHRFWCQVCVTAKTPCHDGSKRREDFGELVYESRKDI